MALSVAPVKTATLTPSTSTTTVANPGSAYPIGTSPTYTQTATAPGAVATWGTPTYQNTADVLPDNSTTLDTSGSGLLTSGTSAADQAAADAAAAAAAKAQQARDSITNLAHSILDVYNGLYGTVDQASADQGTQVNKKYDLEGTGLINQFNQDFPTIGNAYSARGAYDSSYRQDAENNAQTSLADQQDQLNAGRQADLATIGQKRAEERAQLDSNTGGVNAILAQIGNTTDPNELLQIQNQIQQKLLDAQAQSASLGTQGGYVSQLQSLVPTQDQTASIQANLHSILMGAANPMLKKSVGTKLIQTSGLPDDQKNALLASFTTAVDQNKNPQV